MRPKHDTMLTAGHRPALENWTVTGKTAAVQVWDEALKKRQSSAMSASCKHGDALRIPRTPVAFGACPEVGKIMRKRIRGDVKLLATRKGSRRMELRERHSIASFAHDCAAGVRSRGRRRDGAGTTLQFPLG
ncbi:hypothetical protein HIM_01259 [Hirsutella minnesotensis 3608]|nr:hypothetical protein HIM_01259 [Hirsutella minnesotensis 3608]